MYYCALAGKAADVAVKLQKRYEVAESGKKIFPLISSVLAAHQYCRHLVVTG